MEVLDIGRFDTNANIHRTAYRFSLDDSQYLRFGIQGEELSEKSVHPYPIKEYAVDHDSHGHIGAVILDQEGQFYYYNFNGQSWDTHLLYQAALDAEKIDFVDIKYTNRNPQIFFCWRDLSSPFKVSIVTYFTEDGSWKKKIIARTYFKNNCKPYCITKDHGDNLYLSFLTNNNMIYDLKLSVYRIETAQWEDAFYLSDCIYIKNFFIDMLADEKGNLHISWTDKNKSNYCIKYLCYTIDSAKKTTNVVIEKDQPIKWFFQYINHDVFMIIYVANEEIYYIYAHLLQNCELIWSREGVRIHHITTPVFSKILPENITHTNFGLYNDLESKTLLNLFSLVSREDLNQLSVLEANLSLAAENRFSNNPSMINRDMSISNRKQQPYHNPPIAAISKSQLESNGRKNIISTMESEIRFLKEEVKKLTDLNRKYLHLINESGDKISQYKEQIQKWEGEKDIFQHKILALEKKCVSLEKEREKLHGELILSQQQNQLFKDGIKEKETILTQQKQENVAKKESGFFKRIFK
ncbi:hypothetical protein SAMN02745975_00063 [Geosporobacter subterraneus DSM 17957]|uniref:Uncharacterized protein n=1 Tax=Geosporobacter subterraneus DSM 17957 TaxID=1121919 RepID=A0A1M6BUR3_9FIRM|nr:hypothetical protein [Geosporobacter subterraneus]SHI52397.1 hypothetical protein SAMN02745975_00063 [Geosporobacter subterraneus DSM 17957]